MQKIDFKNPRFQLDFEPILKTWIDITSSYTDTIDPTDSLYWNNERATLSTFAGAAWKNGHYALEEYCSYKGRRGEILKNGRTDLWIHFNEMEYIFEAKQIWIPISDQANDPIEKMITSLNKARREVVYSKEIGQTGFGIVFTIPRIAPTFKNNSIELINNFVSKIHAIDYDFMAYTFPEKGMSVVDDEDNSYPGVVLLARVPKRKKKRTEK